jgi:hypothetical protein
MESRNKGQRIVCQNLIELLVDRCLDLDSVHGAAG